MASPLSTNAAIERLARRGPGGPCGGGTCGHPGEIFTVRCVRLTPGGGDNVDIVKGNMGWIEVIVGPMFSGKSEELIRRLRRAEIGRQRVQIFKPVIDQRYSKNGIVSHSGLEIPSELVTRGAEILEKVAPRTEVVGIDEAQFLGETVVADASHLAALGKRVIFAGLDTDFMGRPFEPMPRLLAVAEEITKLLAICMRCGNPAVHTQRI